MENYYRLSVDSAIEQFWFRFNLWHQLFNPFCPFLYSSQRFVSLHGLSPFLHTPSSIWHDPSHCHLKPITMHSFTKVLVFHAAGFWYSIHLSYLVIKTRWRLGVIKLAQQQQNNNTTHRLRVCVFVVLDKIKTITTKPYKNWHQKGAMYEAGLQHWKFCCLRKAKHSNQTARRTCRVNKYIQARVVSFHFCSIPVNDANVRGAFKINRTSGRYFMCTKLFPFPY